jgi:hypothetical protein
MIRIQIIERPEADLHRTLVGAMRSGALRTFELKKRGRQVQHKNPSIPGWMKWSHADGIISCEVRSPRKPGGEWHLFSAFLGRLADRYREQILAINVQFPAARATGASRTKRRTRRRSSGR